MPDTNILTNITNQEILNMSETELIKFVKDNGTEHLGLGLKSVPDTIEVVRSIVLNLNEYFVHRTSTGIVCWYIIGMIN